MTSAITLALALVQAPSAQAAAPAITVKPVRTMQGFRALAFAPAPTGSRFAATMEDNSVRIIDANTRQTIRTLIGHPQPAYAIAWSADGSMIATGDESARILIWNANTGEKLRETRNHQRGIQALDFNAAGTLLVSTGKDDVIKLWDPKTGKEIRTLRGEGANFYSARFIGRTNEFGTGILGSGFRIYRNDGQQLRALTGHEGQGVFDIWFNNDGTRAVTAGRDGKGALWDVKGGKRLNYLRGHTEWVVQARFSPNNRVVATSSPDRTVRVYNAVNYQPIAVIEDQSAVGAPIAFTADGKYLVTTDFSDFVQIHAITPAQAAAPPAPAPRRRR
jgi:hypothetical protein